MPVKAVRMIVEALKVLVVATRQLGQCCENAC